MVNLPGPKHKAKKPRRKLRRDTNKPAPGKKTTRPPVSHPGTGGTTTTTTDTSSTGQGAGEETTAPMMTSASTTAPATAAYDEQADNADGNLESFFSTGHGYVEHYGREPSGGDSENDGDSDDA